MLLYPNCKINLGLRVTEKRPDGYHNIETVFYPVFGLCDVLEVNHSLRTDDIIFEEDGHVLDCAPEDNLVVRCYRLMREAYGAIGGVEVRLRKRIPFGAGLGGGSSDAAYMAYALNELFALGLTREALADTVSRLGADCAFFLFNTPCYATGIGDVLRPISVQLHGMRLVLLRPDEGVSTQEAYRGIVPKALPHLLPGEDMREIGIREIMTFRNDFEPSVFASHPKIAAVKEALLRAGARYASMSGSGSTVFGLFEDDAEGSADAKLGRLDEEMSAMIIFNDTLR